MSERTIRTIAAMGEQPTCTTLPDGTKMWRLHGRLHRTDGPAFEGADGTKAWYVHGERHRTDGPAFEGADGSKAWYVDDKRHRTDGPAVERADGTKEWYVDDKRHRTDGPAVERADGTKEWYLNGQLHRTDGPAVERADGTKTWYLNGQRHRTDGPAVEWADGTKQWWLDGGQVAEAEHAKHTGAPTSNPLGNFQTVAFEIVDQLEGAADSIRRLATMEHTSDAVEVARSIVAEVTGIPANANLTRLVLTAGGAQRTTKEP